MATRIGFLGFGIMGERLLRAAVAHDPSVIVVSGIYDPSPDAGVRLKAIGADLKVYGTAEDLIVASDVVHIASPPLSHLGYLAACHVAGKAALCEKPLATDVGAATAMVERLTANGMRAGVNFPFASSFGVDRIAGWMSDGTVGRPERVDITVAFKQWPRSWQMDAERWLDGRAEGGFVREVVSHFLFLARRQLGPLTLLSARTAYPVDGKSERGVAAQLTAGGIPVALQGAVGSSGLDDHNLWVLSGDRGRVRLRDWAIAEVERDGIWVAPDEAVANEKMRPLVLKRQLDKVAAMTRGEATNLATLAEALEVQGVVEAILAAE